MSIIVNKDSKVLVQGFTGSEGTFHSEQMIEYGTNVVCGVTPGKGGTKHLDKPVYNSVADAIISEDINTSIIFVILLSLSPPQTYLMKFDNPTNMEL